MLHNKPLSNEILQKYSHLSNKVAIFILKRLWKRIVLITDTERSSYWKVYTHSDGQALLCPYQKQEINYCADKNRPLNSRPILKWKTSVHILISYEYFLK